MNKAEINEAEYFNNNFQKYEAELHFNRKPAIIKATLLSKKIIKKCQINDNSKILEIGCGAGFFTKFMLKQTGNAEYHALDISEKMLATIKDHKNLTKVKGSVYDLDFPDNTFDTVLGHQILHHLDIKKCFPEIFRVLKPNGNIFFYDPNAFNPIIFLGWRVKLIKFYDSITEDETAYFKHEISNLLKKVGFTIIDVTPVEFMLNQIPDKYIPLVFSLSKIIEKIPLIKKFGGSLSIFAQKGAK